MIFFTRRARYAMAACLLAGMAHAQQKHTMTSTRIALESTAGSVMLPSGPNSTLVLSMCAGCAPKSFLATAVTVYALNEQPTTLSALKAAVAGRPGTTMTVIYVAATGELARVNATVDTSTLTTTP